MNYRHREDREIRRKIKHTAPYESRHTMRGHYEVNSIVDKFSKGLKGYGAADDSASYVPKFLTSTGNETELLDKYYIPSHYAPRDILTELGNFGEGTWGKIKGTVLGLGAGTITGLAVEALVAGHVDNAWLKELASPTAASIAALATYWFVK